MNELLPGYGVLSNPTDLTSAATGRPGVFRAALETIAADPAVDVAVPAFTFAGKADIRRAAELARDAACSVVLNWSGGCNDDPALTPETLAAEGIAVYRDMAPCMRAIARAAWYREWRETRRRTPPARPADLPENPAPLAPGARLAERNAKALLARYGLRVPRESLARTAAEAVALAGAMPGPVALKIASADILHKTEAGGVRLGLAEPAEIERAHDEIVANARAFAPRAHIDGVLVQEMVPRGVEMILGVVHDASFGAVVLAGMGGVQAELLKDVSRRLPPLSHDEANAMLRELRGFALLDGYRGAPPADIDALADAIVRLSWFAVDQQGRLAELDLNPVTVLPRGQGAVVVDAVIVARD